MLGFNRKLHISVGTAGPRPRAPDISTSQGALAGLNRELRISVGTAEFQVRAPDLEGAAEPGLNRKSAASVEVWQCLCHRKFQDKCRMPDRMPDRMPS